MINSNKEFWHKIIPFLLDNGRVEIVWAIKHTKPIAFKLIFINGEQNIFFIACYNSEFSNISPGVMLQNFALQKYSENAVKQIDMMTDIGALKSHKERWATNFEVTWKHVVFQENLRGRIVALTQL